MYFCTNKLIKKEKTQVNCFCPTFVLKAAPTHIFTQTNIFSDKFCLFCHKLKEKSTFIILVLFKLSHIFAISFCENAIKIFAKIFLGMQAQTFRFNPIYARRIPL